MIMDIKKIKSGSLSVAARTRESAAKLQLEMRKHFTTAISAAFAFVIALVWRDAIKEIIDKIIITLNIPESTYYYSIIAAIVVTILCVLGITIVSRYSVKKEK